MYTNLIIEYKVTEHGDGSKVIIIYEVDLFWKDRNLYQVQSFNKVGQIFIDKDGNINSKLKDPHLLYFLNKQYLKQWSLWLPKN
jgi:hypothetical protein